MSRVYVRRIDRDGTSETIGEVANSWLFHPAVWGGLMRIHGIATGYTHDLKTLGKLWSQAAKLPRADGLLLAATFDRCWFHREIISELIIAMVSEKRFDSNLCEVVRVVEQHGIDGGMRGVAFSGSIASPWNCGVTDGLHVLSRSGHRCRNCNKCIQDAEHMLADKKCCREPEEATYHAED